MLSKKDHARSTGGAILLFAFAILFESIFIGPAFGRSMSCVFDLKSPGGNLHVDSIIFNPGVKEENPEMSMLVWSPATDNPAVQLDLFWSGGHSQKAGLLIGGALDVKSTTLIAEDKFTVTIVGRNGLSQTVEITPNLKTLPEELLSHFYGPVALNFDPDDPHAKAAFKIINTEPFRVDIEYRGRILGSAHFDVSDPTERVRLMDQARDRIDAADPTVCSK